MTEAICDCGAVRLQVTEDPTEINDCHCSWCQRLGALWAYYEKDQVRILCAPDATSVYMRAAHEIEFHRCKVCGLTTHWLPVDPERSLMGVNTRMMPTEVRARAKVFQDM